MKSLIFSPIFLFVTTILTAQVGIGTTSPDASSILDISASDKGILIPRMTKAQRDLISSPANGLLIYNTDSDELQFNSNNSATPIWQALSLTPTSLASVGDSLKYSNTDTTTNVNPSSTINLPIFGTMEWNDDAVLYVVSGNQLTVTETGRYEIIVNVSLLNGTTNDRNAPEIRLAVNGTAIGSYGSTGYIRSNNGHEEASLHLREIIELTANDIITVHISRSANSNTVNMRSTGSSNFFIEKKL